MNRITPTSGQPLTPLPDQRPLSEITSPRQLSHFFNHHRFTLDEITTFVLNNRQGLPPFPPGDNNVARIFCYVRMMFDENSLITVARLLNFINQMPHFITEAQFFSFLQTNQSQPLTQDGFIEMLTVVDQHRILRFFRRSEHLLFELKSFSHLRGMAPADMPGLSTSPHLMMIHLMQNNLATMNDILSFLGGQGVAEDFMTFLEDIHSSLPPIDPPAPATTNRPREATVQGFAQNQQRFTQLLTTINSRQFHDFFTRYELLVPALELFYQNHASASELTERRLEASDGTDYLAHDVIMVYLLHHNRITYSQILTLLNQYGLTEVALMGFLNSPNPPQQPSNLPTTTPQQRLTQETFLDLLHNNAPPLGTLFQAYDGLPSALVTFFNRIQGEINHIVFLGATHVNYNGIIRTLLQENRTTFSAILTQLAKRGLSSAALASYLQNPGLPIPQTPTAEAFITLLNRTTGSQLIDFILQHDVLNLALIDFYRSHNMPSGELSVFVNQDHSNFSAYLDHKRALIALLENNRATPAEILNLLLDHGVMQEAFNTFIANSNLSRNPAATTTPPRSTNAQQPSPPPNIPRAPAQPQPSPNIPRAVPSNSQPPKPLVRRSIESISSKELNSLFSADIKKASSASLWKHRLWKTAAITTLVAYSALTLAALLITGFFAPFLVLPIVALSSIGLFFPTLKLYNSLQPKITASKKIADEEHNIAQELAKLNKLSDAEFSKQYSHLFNLDKIQHPEIETLIAEKGVNLYRPIIARLNHYNNKSEQLQKKEEQLEKTYAMKRNKEDLAAGRYFLNEKHKLHLEIADAKIHAAFIQALLQEPSTLKNKKLTDLCTLNKLDYLNANLAEHFNKIVIDPNSKQPNPKDVFKTPASFATFKDPKIKNLELSKIIKSNVGQLADHILGY